MRVCGVDGGTIKAGLCVLDDRERLMYSVQLTLSGPNTEDRVSCLRRRVLETVAHWQVDHLAIEVPIHHPRTRDRGALAVAAGYHGVMLLATEQGWPRPLLVNPTTAKVMLTSNSKATKQEMMHHAALRWPDHAGLWGEDEADGAAVALVGLTMIREQVLLQMAGGKGGKR